MKYMGCSQRMHKNIVFLMNEAYLLTNVSIFYANHPRVLF